MAVKKSARKLLMNYLERYLRLSSKGSANKHREWFNNLPVPNSTREINTDSVVILLPKWASDIGVGSPSSLVVPSHCVAEGDDPVWQDVDWFRAAFDMATCQAECQYEQQNKPVHSYALRLPKSLSKQWDYAWVNRIVLFLQRWAARQADRTEEELFGKKPRGKIHLTHDVDYVSKTLALRFKQSIFSVLHIIKFLMGRDFAAAKGGFGRLFRFSFGGGQYKQFSNITNMEAEYDLKSTWNFYGGVGGYKRTVTELILDPAYSINDKYLSNQIQQLKDEGHQIGLHQGFHSWRASKNMLAEKKRVEESLGEKIVTCRQHWLRFSFADTWKAQEQAGLQFDTTLGFNERSGFRNSAALRMPAWIASEQRFSESLETLPMVLMDSHLFDYGQMNAEERKKIIDYILDEIEFVGGEATIIWHQRVFHQDYNWGEDYRYLLKGIKSRGLY